MEEQARSLVTGHVKRYTEDSNTAAEVFRWVFYISMIIVHLYLILTTVTITILHPTPTLSISSVLCHCCFFRLHWWEIVFVEIVDSILPLVDNCRRLVNKSSDIRDRVMQSCN